MNKAFWSHLSILGECWEKRICSSLLARLMEEFPASKMHLQPATWVSQQTCPDTTDKFQPFSGGGWGGGGIAETEHIPE